MSLNTLTGHRSVPRRICHRPTHIPRQGPAPVSSVFPAGVGLRLLDIRLEAVQLSPCRAGPLARHPVRLGMTASFLACYGPLMLPFGSGLAIGSRDLPPISPRCARDITLHLMAQSGSPVLIMSAVKRFRCSGCLRGRRGRRRGSCGDARPSARPIPVVPSALWG